MRRRLFGRSHESAMSILNSSARSKESSSPSLPDKVSKDKDKDGVKDIKEKDMSTAKEASSPGPGLQHARSKKSMETKHSDRLSIFGTTFGGTLGKNRKLPPRFVLLFFPFECILFPLIFGSCYFSSDEIMTEKPSKFSLPRLHSSSIRKSSSTTRRPSTSSGGSPRNIPHDFFGMSDEREKEKEKDPAVLRKRTTSNSSVLLAGTGLNLDGTTVNGNPRLLTQGVKGVNIMDQIGEPDHTGWMRKKGDRYNSWKLRYFILKGPHLYFLRSNNRTVSCAIPPLYNLLMDYW